MALPALTDRVTLLREAVPLLVTLTFTEVPLPAMTWRRRALTATEAHPVEVDVAVAIPKAAAAVMARSKSIESCILWALCDLSWGDCAGRGGG